MKNFKKYFNEDFDLEEAISFTGYFEFDDSKEELEFNTKWAKNLNGEIAKIFHTNFGPFAGSSSFDR